MRRILELFWLLRRHIGCPSFTNRSPSSVSAPPQAALKRWKSCSRTCRRTAAWPSCWSRIPVGYETSLPDILGRHSAMAVTIAGNGEAIEPNHVYVIQSPAKAWSIMILDPNLDLPLRRRSKQDHSAA